jgi:arginine-tRNA-protein transferase
MAISRAHPKLFYFAIHPMQPYYQYIEPAALLPEDLDQLLALGWYRMHQTMFTISHLKRDALHRVHWLRFPVAACTPRTSHERIRKRASAFSVTIEDATGIASAHEALYARYYEAIRFDGATSIADSLFGDEPVGPSIFQTKCISVYAGAQVVAAGYFDVGRDSAASILHFFDPAYARFSLGKLLILETLDYLRTTGRTWYYPGYVVEGDRKMNYKLFLGAEHAWYFDPEVVAWKPLRTLPVFDQNFAAR